MNKIGLLSFIAIFLICFTIVGYFVKQNREVVAAQVDRNALERLRSSPPPPIKKEPDIIVFLGDSLTQRGTWSDYFKDQIIINHGITGNQTNDVLDRLPSVLQSHPNKLFLMVGVNDLWIGNKEPEEILKNYVLIINKIMTLSPQTKVYIQSILPVNDELLKPRKVFSQKIVDINKELSSVAAKSSNLTYIDLYNLFSESDSLKKEYTTDGVHLSTSGFAKWSDAVRKYID